MIRKGLNHNGFAYLEVLQACPTYNKFQTHGWYLDKIKDVSEYEGYDNSDLWSAKKIVEKDRDLEFPIGVIYQTEGKNFLERLPHRQGIDTGLVEEVKSHDISELLEELV
jgi:2-oxoglutarate ferredoxin oxidoreductase subunit beta